MNPELEMELLIGREFRGIGETTLTLTKKQEKRLGDFLKGREGQYAKVKIQIEKI